MQAKPQKDGVIFQKENHANHAFIIHSIAQCGASCLLDMWGLCCNDTTPWSYWCPHWCWSVTSICYCWLFGWVNMTRVGPLPRVPQLLCSTHECWSSAGRCASPAAGEASPLPRTSPWCRCQPGWSGSAGCSGRSACSVDWTWSDRAWPPETWVWYK